MFIRIILPVTQTEDALAIVLGHEITHAVAGHGRERMSEAMLAQDIQIAGDVALGNDQKTVEYIQQCLRPNRSIGCFTVRIAETRNMKLIIMD